MSSVAAAARPSGPFSTAAVVTMVVVGAVAALLFLVLSAEAPDLRSPTDGGAHALSRSAVGFAGLTRLLRETGVPVVVSRGEVPVGPKGLLILTPGLSSNRADLNAAIRTEGRTLIILPKWGAAPDLRHPGWVRKMGMLPPKAIADGVGLTAGSGLAQGKGVSSPVLGPGADLFAAGTRLQFGRVESLQTRTGGGATPALVDPNGAVVLSKAVGRNVYVLTDPDLLNNHGLASLQSARSGLAMLDALRGYDGPVIFDVTLNGYKRSRNLLKVLLEPPFLAATLCGLAAALLMGLHAAVRFGPTRTPERAIALGKRALADNAAALIRLAKRQPKMGGRYAALTRAQAARAVGAPRDLAPEALEPMLDRLSRAQPDTPPFSALASAARSAETEADLMQAAKALYRWRVEMTRERQ